MMYGQAGHYIVPKRWTKATEAVLYHDSGVTEERPNDRRGRGASGATEQRGCQPTMMSSRVPAGE